jgi:hypothetical protein
MTGSALSGLATLAAQQGSLRQAFAEDPKRASRFSVTGCGITLDYSKNLIDNQSWQALQQLGTAVVHLDPRLIAAVEQAEHAMAGLAITARGLRPSALASSACRPLVNTTAALWLRRTTTSAVSSRLASPRTPSVPNKRPIG